MSSSLLQLDSIVSTFKHVKGVFIELRSLPTLYGISVLCFEQAESGGQGVTSRRGGGQSGSEQFVMKVPNNKVCKSYCIFEPVTLVLFRGLHLTNNQFQVGLVIGKGGETIKNMQARTGARIQVEFQFILMHFSC